VPGGAHNIEKHGGLLQRKVVSCGEENVLVYEDVPYDDYAVGTIVGTPEMIRERLQPVIDAGIDYFIVTIPREA
jgi:alkanesulfonate monooxygenase SsuD/methylene tetrahydromethanopterin reductase-like flavin-dependent oxidoreductase (luciferase family)